MLQPLQSRRLIAQAELEGRKALVYTDASARNKVCSIGLVGPKTGNLIGSYTIG